MEKINPVWEWLSGMAPVCDDNSAMKNAWRLAQMRVDDYNAMEEPPGDTGYDCRICRNKQMIFRLEANPDGSPHQIARGCKCVATRESIRKMQRSGLKDIIGDNQFDKFDTPKDWQQTIKAAAVEYAKTLDGWFLLAGQTGCGKTHLCTAICREALLRGQSVAYMMWREDAPRIKAKINDSHYSEAVEDFKKADVLYIDDLFKIGKQDGKKIPPTSADINLAFEIINHRYVNKLPTIISTEFTLAELINVDEATAGRIAERAGAYAITIRKDREKNFRLRKVVTP